MTELQAKASSLTTMKLFCSCWTELKRRWSNYNYLIKQYYEEWINLATGLEVLILLILHNNCTKLLNVSDTKKIIFIHYIFLQLYQAKVIKNVIPKSTPSTQNSYSDCVQIFLFGSMRITLTICVCHNEKVSLMECSWKQDRKQKSIFDYKMYISYLCRAYRPGSSYLQMLNLEKGYVGFSGGNFKP